MKQHHAEYQVGQSPIFTQLQIRCSTSHENWSSFAYNQLANIVIIQQDHPDTFHVGCSHLNNVRKNLLKTKGHQQHPRRIAWVLRIEQTTITNARDKTCRFSLRRVRDNEANLEVQTPLSQMKILRGQRFPLSKSSGGGIK